MSVLSSVLQVVTKDLVCTEATAVCYYRIENVSVCYSSLAGVPAVLQALVQVSVREVLALHTFTSILQNRSEVAHQIQVYITNLFKICFQKAKSNTKVQSMFSFISFRKLQVGPKITPYSIYICTVCILIFVYVYLFFVHICYSVIVLTVSYDILL